MDTWTDDRPRWTVTVVLRGDSVTYVASHYSSALARANALTMYPDALAVMVQRAD